MDINIEQIKEKFKDFEHYISGWKEHKRAAVIIPLVYINNKLSILFEVRSKKLNSQPGDVCFPGGRIEFNETPSEAAKREMYEELNIYPNDVQIIKEMDTFVRYDGIIVHPFLGYIRSINNIKSNEEEVYEYFTVPLDYLLNYNVDEYNNTIEVKRSEDFPYHLINKGRNYEFRDGSYKTTFYKYKIYVIWGLTAIILKDFICNIKEIL